MFQNKVMYDFVLLLFSSLGLATSNRPSNIRPHSTYLPASLVANTNSTYFIQARKINSEEILLRENITYDGRGLFVDRLVWDVHPHQSAVHASYGPFQVSQSDSLIFNSSELHNLNVQTHIITKNVHPYSPSLNILFYLDQEQLRLLKDFSICVNLHIFYTKGMIISSCMLSKSTRSCFLDVAIPMEWWLDVSDAAYQNSKLQLSYRLSKTINSECTRKDNSLRGRSMGTLEKSAESQQAPLVYLGEIPLQPFAGHYTRGDSGSRVILKTPDNKDVSSTHGFAIPFSIPQDFQAESFAIKMKPRKGLNIRAVHFHDSNIPWQRTNSSDEESTSISFILKSPKELEDFNALPPREVPLFLVEFEVTNETSHSRHISWRIDVTQNGELTSSKTSSKIGLSRGSILALVPIVEKSELLNTAVLNHQEVSAALRVLAVSYDHTVVDVTNQSVCSSADRNILKVKQNCSYMYLDGSEDSSTSDISITASYEGKSVDFSVWVWMPEVPLTIELSDHRLSLIKEWKVPHRGLRRHRRSAGENKCRLRYQQATVTVYTRFYTKHANSGRKVYMLGKDIREDVTSLLNPDQFTTSNSEIATIDNHIVYGHSDGLISMQILPGKGNKALGYKEFTVGGDKVSVTDLHISLVTGLSIHTVKDVANSRLKAVRVKANDQLIAKYQEGILDVTLGFSDGAILPLRHVSAEDFAVNVLSHDHNIIVERSDSLQAAHIVAIAEGATTVNVKLQLPRMCHKKHKSSNTILSRIYPVNVSFSSKDIQQKLRKIGDDGNSGNKAATETVVNERESIDFGIVHVNFDPSLYEKDTPKQSDKGSKKKEGYPIVLDNIPFGNNPPKKEEPPNEDRNRDFTSNILDDIEDNEDKSAAMEIGMYVMLAVFAVAITVFLINCMVYMYRISKRKKVPPSVIVNYTSPNESWSWLGRELDQNLKQEACDYGQEESDMPLTQVYTESEVSVEHHSTSCSESPGDSGSNDISEANLEEEEEINIADESISSDVVVNGSTENTSNETEVTPTEEDTLLGDMQVTVNPLSKENASEKEEPTEYDQLLQQLQSLKNDIET